MEGATLGLRYGLEVMQRNGISPEEIRLIGGGANNPIWRQLVADIFATPVVSPQTADAGALGAALQSMWCHLAQTQGRADLADLCEKYVHLDPSRRAEPSRGETAAYQEVYARYLELDRNMRPLNQA
jgi:sugar (pentulose or hexulose) kinase